MENNMTYIGKFYLKSGQMIEEKVWFDKSENREDVNNYMHELVNNFKKSIRNNYDNTAVLTFGNTVFRISDISAMTIKEINTDYNDNEIEE